jgi:hypothetical protein
VKALYCKTLSCQNPALQVRLMAKAHLGRYRNTMHCLTEVLRTEGPSALFIGLAPTLFRFVQGLWVCLGRSAAVAVGNAVSGCRVCRRALQQSLVAPTLCMSKYDSA